MTRRTFALVATAMSVGCVLAGSALVFADSLTMWVVGYVVGCLVSFTLVVLARRADLQARATDGIVAPGWRSSLHVGVLVLGFLVAGRHAWSIAWEIARRWAS